MRHFRALEAALLFESDARLNAVGCEPVRDVTSGDELALSICCVRSTFRTWRSGTRRCLLKLPDLTQVATAAGATKSMARPTPMTAPSLMIC